MSHLRLSVIFLLLPWDLSFGDSTYRLEISLRGQAQDLQPSLDLR